MQLASKSAWTLSTLPQTARKSQAAVSSRCLLQRLLIVRVWASSSGFAGTAAAAPLACGGDPAALPLAADAAGKAGGVHM